MNTLCFFTFTIQSIPEIIPTTAKGLVAATPKVTSSPVSGAFCDRISKNLRARIQFRVLKLLICWYAQKEKPLDDW